MSGNSELKRLIELENIDLKIIELENSKEEFPKEVDALQKTINNALSAVTAAENRLEQTINDRKSAEDQKTDAGLSMEKSQGRLNSVKTNKEYDAAHTEIDTYRNAMTLAEKKIERLAEEIEAIRAELIAAKSAYEQTEQENQPRIDELNAKIATIDSAIAAVVAERETQAATIEKRFVRTYNHIREGRKTGRVLSIVDRTRRKCSVCFQMLQPQVINRLRNVANIEFCQNCGSILISQEDVVD